MKTLNATLKELSTNIQDGIHTAMDGHEEIFDPEELCDIVKFEVDQYMNNEKYQDMNKKGIEMILNSDNLLILPNHNNRLTKKRKESK